MERYRSHGMRGRIAEWLEHGRPIHNPVIVIVSSSSPLVRRISTSNSSTGGIFAQRPVTLLDRIRADFKGVRVVQAILSTASSDLADLMVALGEVVSVGFHQLITGLEGDCRRLEAQHQLPGWNPFVYFVSREALALAHESVGLHSSALAIYDQLEASFRQDDVSFVEAEPDFSLVPLEQYLEVREALYQSQVSPFQFGCYLFVRQAQALLASQQPGEMLARARRFVSALHHYQSDKCHQSKYHQSNKWTYHLLRQLTSMAEAFSPDWTLASKASYDFYRAEALLVCLQCLTKDDMEDFLETYSGLARSVLEVFALFRLKRREAILSLDWARHQMAYGEWDAAGQLLASISLDDWPQLQMEAILLQATCLKAQGNIEAYAQKTIELANRFGAFDKALASLLETDTSLLESDTSLSENDTSLSENDKSLSLPLDSKLFPIRISPHSTTRSLVVSLENHLFNWDEITVTALDGSQERSFTARNIVPGEGEIKLIPQAPVFPGQYTLSSMILSRRKLVLKIDFLQSHDSSKKTRFHLSQASDLPFRLQVEMPKIINYARPSFKVAIKLKKEQKLSVHIRLNSMKPIPSTDYEIEDGHVKMESFTGEILVEELNDDTIQFIVRIENEAYTLTWPFSHQPIISVKQNWKFLNAHTIIRFFDIFPIQSLKMIKSIISSHDEALIENQKICHLEPGSVTRIFMLHPSTKQYEKIGFDFGHSLLEFPLQLIENRLLASWDFESSTSCVGKPVSAEIVLDKSGDNLKYHLVYNDSMWRINGKRAGNLKGDRLSFSMIPLTQGKLKLPSLNVENAIVDQRNEFLLVNSLPTTNLQ